MRLKLIGALTFLTLAAWILSGTHADPIAATQPTHSAVKGVFFSPSGGCTAATTRLIDNATTSLDCIAYEFTSPNVADAVVRAHRRGIAVRVVLDATAAKQKLSALAALHAAGVPVRLDATHHITHDKVIIADAADVQTGSFNFTAAAESSNAENVLHLHDVETAAAYTADFEKHWSHSAPAR